MPTNGEFAGREEGKPNRFFMALAASQDKARDESPMQVFYQCMKRLQTAAEAGDIRDWQENLNEINSLTSGLGFESMKELETRAQIKRLEMTLLLRAGNKALQEADLAQREAAVAENSGDSSLARELFAKAQKLARLGKQLHAQLLAKTS